MSDANVNSNGNTSGDSGGEHGGEHESLLWRVLRSTIAPDVLEDGGHDAPLSRRGRILFWGTIFVLGAAIAVVFVLTLAK